MATEGWAVEPAVANIEIESLLRNEPCAIEFFQAIRLLERLFPDRQPVGGFGHSSSETVRMATHSSLTFPASEIQSLQWDGVHIPLMRVNFMGMTGLQGPLPLWYTELLLGQVRSGDTSLRDFLDVFNHRSLSLFYRAWQKYRFGVAYERGDRDAFFVNLLALIGLGTPGLIGQQEIIDEALIYYSGLLGQHQRSAGALEQILSDYFEVPVEVHQFIGAWYRLAPEIQCRMDDEELSSQELGRGAVLGDETWDHQSRVRVKIGPLSLAQYREFLPTGSAFKQLQALTQFYSNNQFDYEIQLILQREEVPRCSLGPEHDGSPQLGWVSWVKSDEMNRSPSDTILPL
jgi:type VI secretion system protein ImpH